MNGVNGMKPKLLINVGIEHCATTPLYYTLSVDQQYCHAGHKKEFNYLYLIERKGQTKAARKIFNLRSYNRDDDRKPPFLNTWKWDISEMPEFCEEPFTIEKYIAYYLKHWEHIKYDYESLADFSNTNVQLSTQFLYEIKTILEVHFDVKWIIILRDPIRRLYSYSRNNKRFRKHILNKKYPNYVEICERYKHICGNRFYPIMMERFWEDPSGLSEFLEYPITKVHENVFWPEKGIDFIKMEYLQDQWSVEEPMSDENLELAKKEMAHLYNDGIYET